MSLVYYSSPIIYHLAPRTTQDTFDAIRLECNINLTGVEIVMRVYDKDLPSQVLLEKSTANGGIAITDLNGVAEVHAFILPLKPGLYPYNITYTDTVNNRKKTYIKGTVTVLPNI